MDSKERAISDIMHRMSVALSSTQSDQLLAALTTVLQDYDLQPQTTLPSTDVDDTTKIINHFLAAKRLEGCSQHVRPLQIYHPPLRFGRRSGSQDG